MEDSNVLFAFSETSGESSLIDCRQSSIDIVLDHDTCVIEQIEIHFPLGILFSYRNKF